MPEVKRRRTVNATPETIWELVSDPYHLPRWWPMTTRVEDAEGDAWTSVLRTPAGKTVRADFTRTELSAPRRIEWRQELEESPFERIFAAAVTAIELEPEGDGATSVELSSNERLRGRFRLGSFMVKRAARRRLDDALAGLVRAVDPQ